MTRVPLPDGTVDVRIGSIDSRDAARIGEVRRVTTDWLRIPVEALATVLVADFVSGFVHWAEDAYGREDRPVLGRWITRPNVLHHHRPRHFVRHSWLRSSWDLTLAAAVVVGLAAWAGCLTWHVWLFAVLSANANQVHKWAHRTRSENPWLVNRLHDLHLLQTPGHHAGHHESPKASHYCVLTGMLNPVLDRVGFWTALERGLERCVGIRRRPDTSNPGSGPAPDWLPPHPNHPVR